MMNDHGLKEVLLPLTGIPISGLFSTRLEFPFSFEGLPNVEIGKKYAGYTVCPLSGRNSISQPRDRSITSLSVMIGPHVIN